MLRDWWVDVISPDLSKAAGLRIMLWARYQHLGLKFTSPPESERFEASWNGGSAASDDEHELISTVLMELQDCGSSRHDWITTGEIPDPNNADNTLRTQRLACVYCDPRERVITVSSPPAADADAQAT
jgi:hypothetical protein